MSERLSRIQQSRRNRATVLDAAREVFLSKGFHAATLDQIAEQAGFSKGVVYSQFGSKADLFLALLEERISDRNALQKEIVGRLTGIEDYAALVARMSRISLAELAWTVLVIEFRVYASREKTLNARYNRAHQKTIDGVAAALAALYERSNVRPPAPPRSLAQTILALINGSALEKAGLGSLPTKSLVEAVGRVLGTVDTTSKPNKK